MFNKHASNILNKSLVELVKLVRYYEYINDNSIYKNIYDIK